MKRNPASLAIQTTEARRSERKPVRIAVIVLSESEGKKIESDAYTLDLSEHGLKLQSSIALAQGQIVDLTATDGSECSVRGRVIWTGAVGSAREGEVGFEIVSPFADAYLS